MTQRDKKRLADIRNRVRGVFQDSGRSIEEGRFMYFTSEVFKEMKFLLDVIDGRVEADVEAEEATV